MRATDMVGQSSTTERRPPPGQALVAELLAATGDVRLELCADARVDRRLLVLLERAAPDVRGPGRGVLAAVLRPAVEVLRRRQHRAVEAGAEPLERVRGAQEVAASADLEMRVERQRGL